MTFWGQRSRSYPKNFEVEYLENGTRWRNVVHRSQIGSHIWAFEWYKNFLTPDDFFGSKVKGQTLETLKSNISKTVRDEEMLSMEVK